MINLKRYLKEVSFIVCFFLGLISCFSQTKQNFRVLKGEIVNDSVNISGIHIINKTSGSKTITDINGIFEIGIQKQDTMYGGRAIFLPKFPIAGLTQIHQFLQKMKIFGVKNTFLKMMFFQTTLFVKD